MKVSDSLLAVPLPMAIDLNLIGLYLSFSALPWLVSPGCVEDADRLSRDGEGYPVRQGKLSYNHWRSRGRGQEHVSDQVEGTGEVDGGSL